MTQQIATSLLRLWSEEVDSMRSDMLMADLLSIRAAVRRVLDAEDAWVAACASGSGVYETGKAWREARAALRAEIGGIDKDGGS